MQHHDEALDRLKRGGGKVIVSLDPEESALTDIVPDSKALNPEDAFEREWRNALMAKAVERVRRRLVSEGTGVKVSGFEAYYLNGSAEARPTYIGVAERLGVKEGDVKHYLADVREDVRNEIRSVLAQTLSRPDDFQEEWNAFFGS